MSDPFKFYLIALGLAVIIVVTADVSYDARYRIRTTPKAEPTVVEASGLPVYSFVKSVNFETKEVLRINAERTVYTFSTTNCELVYVDTNGVKFKGQWVREFTNDWKWSDTGPYRQGYLDGRQQRQKEIEFMFRDLIRDFHDYKP